MKKVLTTVVNILAICVGVAIVIGITVITSVQSVKPAEAPKPATSQSQKACMDAWFPSADKLGKSTDKDVQALTAEAQAFCKTLTDGLPKK